MLIAIPILKKYYKKVSELFEEKKEKNKGLLQIWHQPERIKGQDM